MKLLANIDTVSKSDIKKFYDNIPLDEVTDRIKDTLDIKNVKMNWKLTTKESYTGISGESNELSNEHPLLSKLFKQCKIVCEYGWGGEITEEIDGLHARLFIKLFYIDNDKDQGSISLFNAEYIDWSKRWIFK